MIRQTASALAAAVLTICWSAITAPSLAGDGNAPDRLHALTDTWMIARGGRLYDNWMDETEANTPNGTHPAYPAAGAMKGFTTWRCKECHGWDYRGRDGAYGQGPHYSGIKGVRGVRGLSPKKIQKIITNDTHGFTARQIPPDAMKPLALFLSRGQVDSDRYIDRKSRVAHGNPRRGAPMFQTICAMCHGLDGKDINFNKEGGAEYLGALCSGDPWKVLHKIRSGQPGVTMISLASLKTERLVDVLAYCQTLPTK